MESRGSCRRIWARRALTLVALELGLGFRDLARQICKHQTVPTLVLASSRDT